MIKKWIFYMWLNLFFIVPVIALNFLITLHADEWFYVPGIISFVLSFIPLMIWLHLWKKIKGTAAGDAYLCNVFFQKSLSALPVFLLGYFLAFYSNNLMALLVGTPIIIFISSMIFLLVKQIDFSVAMLMNVNNNSILGAEGVGLVHSLATGKTGYADIISERGYPFVNNMGVDEGFTQHHDFHTKINSESLPGSSSCFEVLNVEIDPSSDLPVFDGVDTNGNPYSAEAYNHEINPSSGLPMIGNVDIEGDLYGTRDYHD